MRERPSQAEIDEANASHAQEVEYALFENWWEKHGQYCRAGGGNYEKSFARAAWEYVRSTMVKEN